MDPDRESQRGNVAAMSDAVIEVRVEPDGDARFSPGAFDRQIGRSIKVGPVSATLLSAEMGQDGTSAVLRFTSPSSVAAEAFGAYSIGLSESGDALESRAIPAREYQP